jgi:hypothetical protein
MGNYYCYIPTIDYYNPTHSVTLLSVSDTPVWLGFIVDATSDRVLDARWQVRINDKINDKIANQLDQWCLNCSGVIVSNFNCNSSLFWFDIR